MVLEMLGDDHDVLAQHSVEHQHDHLAVLHVCCLANALGQELLQLILVSEQTPTVFVVLPVQFHELMSVLLAGVIIFQVAKALVCHTLRHALRSDRLALGVGDLNFLVDLFLVGPLVPEHDLLVLRLVVVFILRRFENVEAPQRELVGLDVDDFDAQVTQLPDGPGFVVVVFAEGDQLVVPEVVHRFNAQGS